MSEPQTDRGHGAGGREPGGHIDYLVSNAAINPFMPWNETTLEQWDLICNTNLRGTWVVTTETAKQMIAEGHGGAIVCVELHLGTCRGALPDRLLRHQGRDLDARQGPRKRRWNPRHTGQLRRAGAVLTNMSAPMMDEPEILKYYVDRIALHRIGDPSEMAGVIAFLLSDDASYVTSATLLADAGFIVNAEL